MDPVHPGSVCLGSVFESIHPVKQAGGDYRTTPFYELCATMNESLDDAIATLDKMKFFDGSPDVLVIIAHDSSLMDFLPFFPKNITNWDDASYKVGGTWRFLKDFSKAIELKNAKSS